MLPGLAGTQEDAGITGEGIVERRRLNRLVFSKGSEMDEVQISGKVQINMYLFSNRILDLAEQQHISGINQTAVKSHGFKSLKFCILLKRVIGRKSLSSF